MPHWRYALQGMGEPLNNYSQVKTAVSMMIDPQIFALRRSAVTVSTVGVIPRMLQMIDDLPGVSLALSLHAPTQELRTTIVPSAKAYPLDRLMAAVDKYQMQTRQKVRHMFTFTYAWCQLTLAKRKMLKRGCCCSSCSCNCIQGCFQCVI